MKKHLKLLSALILSALSLTTLAHAETIDPMDVALFASGNVTVNSGTVNGDVAMTGGLLYMTGGGNFIVGSAYTTEDVTVQKAYSSIPLNKKSYDNPVAFELYNDINLPDVSIFDGAEYQDGSQDLFLSWDQTRTLDENANVNTLRLYKGSVLTFSVPEDQVLVMQAKTLEIKGNIKVQGGGKVVIYADKVLSLSGDGKINENGDSKNLVLVHTGSEQLLLDNGIMNAAVITEADVNVNNLSYKGNIYTTGNVAVGNSTAVKGMIYAPNSATTFGGAGGVVGMLITKTVSLNGGNYITKAPTDPLIDGALWKNIQEGFPKEEEPIEPEEPEFVLPEGALEVIEYDPATDSYTHGIMYTKMHTPNGYNYIYEVLDETTFVADDISVSEDLKTKAAAITDTTNYIFGYRKGDISLAPFGRVDSEANTYALTISPFVVPLLDQNGITPQMWLAWGDRNGTVTKAWMTVK